MDKIQKIKDGREQIHTRSIGLCKVAPLALRKLADILEERFPDVLEHTLEVGIYTYIDHNNNKEPYSVIGYMVPDPKESGGEKLNV